MPVLLYTLQNEYHEYLIEERRRYYPEDQAGLTFPAGPLGWNEYYLAALPRVLSQSCGVTLVRANQLYPEVFQNAGVTGPLYYEDPNGERYTIYAFEITGWIGEVLPERRDTHARLRWMDLPTIQLDALPWTKSMAVALGTLH